MATKVEALKAVASLDSKQWNRALDQMAKKSTGFKRLAVLGFKKSLNAAKSMIGGMKKLAKVSIVAGIAAATGIGYMVKKSIDAGDVMDKMSKRTGLATEFLSKLAYAADLSGTSIDVMEKAVKKLQMGAADAKDGLKTYTREFDKLGITVTDSSGQLKSTEKLFMEVVTALSKMTNHTQKAAIASKLLGRAGTQLLPMLSEGTKGMQAMMRESGFLATIWTTKTAAAAASLKDSLTRVKYIAVKLANTFSMALFPVIERISEQVVDWYANNNKLIDSKIIEWANKLGGGIEKAWITIEKWAAEGKFKVWWEAVASTARDFRDILRQITELIPGIQTIIHPWETWKIGAKSMLGIGNAPAGAAQRTTADWAATARSTHGVGGIPRGSGEGVPSGPMGFRSEGVPSGPSSITVNVNVANSLVGEVNTKQAKAIGDGLAKALRQGSSPGLTSALLAIGQ